MAQPKHYLALDGVRGIAVLMVIVSHYFQFARLLPGGATLRLLTLPGATGVDLFFVLSGFLITGILLRTVGSPRYLANFYGRRALRILPLYYSFLIFSYFFMPPVPWTNWFFLQNIGLTFWTAAMNNRGPTHFWSLAVEEHFYLFWPFLVSRFDTNKLLRVLWGIIGGAFVLRLGLLAFGIPITWFTPVRIDTLAAGAIIAVLAHEGRLRPALVRPLVLAPVLAGLLGWFAIRSGLHGPAYQLLEALRAPLLACTYSALLIVAITWPTSSWAIKILENPVLTATGKYSYSMYVIHEAVIRAILSTGLTSLLGGLVLTLGLTYLGALITWHALEKHFLALKKKLGSEKLDTSRLSTVSQTA